MKQELDKLSNAELRIKLKTLENEYDVVRNKVLSDIKKMEELDKLYVEVKELLNKRTKGKLI